MTETELIECILSGNQKCFKDFVDDNKNLVFNTCYSFLHDKTNAEDVTQEVFIEVYLSLKKFKRDSKLTTWLYRISVNKSLNFIRDNRKRSIMQSIENFFWKSEPMDISQNHMSSHSEGSDLEKERLELLHRAIARLPKNQKVAFTLSKLKDLSYKQIAEVMDLSLLSVEGLIHRAKKNVQKEIIDFYKKK